MSFVGTSSKVLLLAVLALGVVGCVFSDNPSYFPYLALPGDIVRTHGKPAGRGYFADFDPHAKTIVVRPEEATNPVRNQVVVIATIYDEKGQPRRNRRVEWMLEGSGNIVEVDESGILAGRGYKVDNRYAVSYTDQFEHRITRGNNNPNDDFVIRPGQSWCVITSAVEGDTHLTVYAPEVHNWEKNKIHVSYHWVDAEWITPPPASVPAGSPHLLTTTVIRHTDRQPLAGYRVRYRLLDGPPAVFLPSKTTEAVAVSDLRGNASVQLSQLTAAAGANRIAIEVIRAPDPTATSAPGIVIGRAETRVDWQAPGLALTVTGPPALALNQEGSYTLTLSNPGRMPLKSITVRHFVPRGTQYVRSEPPAIVEGDQLIWTLGELAGGAKRDLSVSFRQLQAVRVDHRTTAQSEEGLRDEQTMTTLGTQPGLKLNVSGPKEGTVGTPIDYRISLTNSGSGPATGIVLRAQFDDALESQTGANPVELRLDEPLGPGQSRDIPLSLKPRRAGTHVVRVSITGEGGLSDRGEHAVTVREAKLALGIGGPKVRFAGSALTWAVDVRNGGGTELTNAVVRLELPAEVAFVSASEGGQATGREVVWNVGRLRANERVSLQATVNAVALTPSVRVRAQAGADPEGGTGGSIRAESETTLEVRGLPAFRLEVTDENDPIEVGGRTRYTIEVTNQGSLRGSGITINATIPKQLKFISATGPASFKAEGDRIVFEMRDGLEAKQTWTYVVEVEATEAGDARFQAELRAASLGEPVVVQQSTTVYPKRQ